MSDLHRQPLGGNIWESINDITLNKETFQTFPRRQLILINWSINVLNETIVKIWNKSIYHTHSHSHIYSCQSFTLALLTINMFLRFQSLISKIQFILFLFFCYQFV